jgi:hypothetical protein
VGRPKYVTAVSRCDVVDGWRARPHEGDIIFDVETNKVLTEELSMPHSSVANRALWVLDSVRGYLCRVDEKGGTRNRLLRGLR